MATQNYNYSFKRRNRFARLAKDGICKGICTFAEKQTYELWKET